MDPFTQFGLHKVMFCFELLIAELLFTYRLKRRSRYVIRLSANWLVCLAVTLFMPVIPVIQDTAIGTSLVFVLLFILSILFLKLCYDESWGNLLFCSLAAYTTVHFAYACFELVMDLSGLLDMTLVVNASYWLESGGETEMFFDVSVYIFKFACCVFAYWLAFVLFVRRIKKGERLVLSGTGFLALAVFILVANSLLNSVIVYHSYEWFDKVYYFIIALYNILTCLIALELQFMAVKKNQLQSELDAVSCLLHEKEKQYALSKETIDLINQKCHDMKHQIGLLGSSHGIGSEAVKEMEEVISVYDSFFKTGNEALDIILSEKTLSCRAKGIRLTCLAEGEKLNFMRDTDLYSLFGNLIDNAVEAAVKLPSEEKKVISLGVKSVRGMVTVSIRNYFIGEVKFENGMPESSKGDKRYHGFGLKSVRRIVEKYEGDLSVRVEEDVFTVNILFPATPAEGL